MSGKVLFYRCEPSEKIEAWLSKHNFEILLLNKKVHVEDVKGHEATHVVIDIDKCDDAFEACRNINVKLPSINIIAQSYNDSLEDKFKEVGVNTFLLKKPVEYEVTLAFSPRNRKGSSPLTEREEEVLKLISLGHTNKNVAELLDVTEKTVEAHRSRIFRKMGASNIADLILLSVKSGLIEV